MTKPTKLQEKACERLADALLMITEAARLDGKGAFNASDLDEVASRLVRASSVFDLDAIVARALEMRGRALGRRSGTAELLMLLEGDLKPLSMLLLPDDAFNERMNTIDAELGEM
ncbi:hypothetical protein V5E97_23665 [Singulisphaera sp. Ch08]|uniref:Uncharacterized protein n=1 Tax=Singulisphaera sp. Ch08 TaxID=3120278 RepID=A0AAU7C885_9BACT